MRQRKKWNTKEKSVLIPESSRKKMCTEAAGQRCY